MVIVEQTNHKPAITELSYRETIQRGTEDAETDETERKPGYTALRWREPVIVFAPVVITICSFGLVAGLLWAGASFMPGFAATLSLGSVMSFALPTLIVGGVLAAIIFLTMMLVASREASLSLLLGLGSCVTLTFGFVVAGWLAVSGMAEGMMPAGMAQWFGTLEGVQKYFFYYLASSLGGIALVALSLNLIRWFGLTKKPLED
jgi:hypothetical protein